MKGKLEKELKIDKFTSVFTKAATNIMYSYAWMTEQLNTICKTYDISTPQYNILRVLSDQNGVPVKLSYIRDRMMQKNSNTTRLVDKLKQKNLVERKPSKTSRRQLDITITKKGLKVYAELTPLLVNHENYMNKQFTKADAEMLNELLNKMRGAVH